MFTVFNNDARRFALGPVDLTPGQTLVLRQPVDTSTRCSGADTFYQVSYERQGVGNEALLPGSGTSTSPSTTPVVGTVVGGLIGLVSAAIGTLLAHRLTLAREQSKQRREAFDRKEPVFNAFFMAWNRSPLAQELQTRFNDLQRQISLDQKVVNRYRKALGVLANAEASASRKEEEATEFELYMREYLRQLNPD